MKIRKSVKYIWICISIIILLITSNNIFGGITKRAQISENKEIYRYTNKYNYKYTVNMKDNKYIPEKSFEMTQKAYVTDLIDNINLNLSYSYEGSKESNINYNYQIIGRLSASYSKDGEECKIWESDDIIKDLVSDSQKSNSISINEDLDLDLSKKNALVKEFEDEMGMAVTANYTIMLKINTNTNVENEEVNNECVPMVVINLGEKITTINGEKEEGKTEFISKKYVETADVNTVTIVLNIIGIIIALVILSIVLRRKSVNIIRNEYRQELNRLLRICQDKIVKVSQNPNSEKENVMDVADFGEIVKLSEELFQPILYWYCEATGEAHFSVISNNSSYRFILKK